MKYWIMLKRWLASLRKPKDKTRYPDSDPFPGRVNEIERVRGMLSMIEKTQTAEIDCGEVYRLLDQYTEMVVRGEDPSELMPLVKQHLELCMDCREEYEALLNILRSN